MVFARLFSLWNLAYPDKTGLISHFFLLTTSQIFTQLKLNARATIDMVVTYKCLTVHKSLPIVGQKYWTPTKISFLCFDWTFLLIVGRQFPYCRLTMLGREVLHDISNSNSGKASLLMSSNNAYFWSTTPWEGKSYMPTLEREVYSNQKSLKNLIFVGAQQL